MAKCLGRIVIVAVVACFSSSPAHGGPRDFWIGVIGYDLTDDQPKPARFYAGVEPVAALVNGKWWFGTRDLSDTAPFLPSIGKVPAQWLPVGKDLPKTWRTRLSPGRAVNLHMSGALHVAGCFEHVTVATDLELPQLQQNVWDCEVKGIAFAGNVGLRPFVDLSKATRAELRRFLAPSMLKAEREAIHQRASVDDADEMAKATAMLPASRLASASFEMVTAKTASLSDGSIVYLIEGTKRFRADGACGQTSTGASARRDVSGTLHLLGAWSELVCDDLYVAHEPLVVLHRGGVTCWLTAWIYEDGVEYVVSRAGRIDKERPACDIR